MLKGSSTKLSKAGTPCSKQPKRLNGTHKPSATLSQKPSLVPGSSSGQISKASSIQKHEQNIDINAKSSKSKQGKLTNAVHAARNNRAKLVTRIAGTALKPQQKAKDANHAKIKKLAAGARSKASPSSMQCSTGADSSKPVAAVTESTAVTAARGADDLDDIFATLGPKRARRDAERAALKEEDAKAEKRERARAEKKRKRVVDPVFGEEYDIDRAIDPQNAKVHRFDSQSGLRVFKAHDLGLGRGGDTPLCPFDCKCCF
mmetsp:Transcript_8312/g.16416  ORF Transcript_8312/g.16416 Transcript_8312/m.16416 type:complete len:260 (+) Transcript_8312:427-1206(+)